MSEEREQSIRARAASAGRRVAHAAGAPFRGAARAARWTRRHALELVSDALIVGGLAAVTYGVAMIYVPAAWATGGAFTAVFGWLVGRRAVDDDDGRDAA